MLNKYSNRAAAGHALGVLLSAYRGRDEVIVLGLPRGGVPVAFEVARILEVPLDVLVVRKLGAPGAPEFALGAIASGGIAVINEEAMELFRDSPEVRTEIARQRAELWRREALYRGDRTPLQLAGRTAILVDDGAATGASMRAAIRAVRELGAEKVVVALPVASVSACLLLHEEADEVVCGITPGCFQSVGEWYVDFRQTDDDEVRQLLARADVEPVGTRAPRMTSEPLRG
jgi:predicted phosphoribosyltransferase